MFWSCQIIIRELCSLLKLYYGIHNSILICKRGVVAAYHVVWECVVEQWLGVHDMLPQQLVCKYELNCEYRNITLARNKAPWWWSDKIKTCRSVLKCLKVFYVKLYVHSLVDKLKWPLDILLPPFIIRSVHYKTVRTTYVVEPKILHYLVHVLQSNIPMHILQSYVYISMKWYLRKSGC